MTANAYRGEAELAAILGGDPAEGPGEGLSRADLTRMMEHER